MAFRLYWRGDLIYSRHHNSPLSIEPSLDKWRKPVVTLSHPRREGGPLAATEITTWDHLDLIFEALIAFERYGSAIKDHAANYAQSKGVKVSTFTNESFNK